MRIGALICCSRCAVSNCDLTRRLSPGKNQNSFRASALADGNGASSTTPASLWCAATLAATAVPSDCPYATIVRGLMPFDCSKNRSAESPSLYSRDRSGKIRSAIRIHELRTGPTRSRLLGSERVGEACDARNPLPYYAILNCATARHSRSRFNSWVLHNSQPSR